MAGLMCAGAIFLGVVLAGAKTSPTAENKASPAVEPSEAVKPLLEGTELHEERGTFRMSGDRMTFISADQKRTFMVMENQTLQRVAESLSDYPIPQQWIVSGTVTEYRGNNYLLLTRAVLKASFLPEEGSPAR
jgi:hypothetical protein